MYVYTYEVKFEFFFISVLIWKLDIRLLSRHVNEKKTDKNHPYDKRIPYQLTQRYTV